MRILLVMPTPFESGRLGLENVVWLSEPVALTSIGAMVSDRHEVRILDMRLEPEHALAAALRDFAPDLVGTTSMTTDAYQAQAVLRMTRAIRPDALTVIGGHHPTLSPDEFDTPYIDVIVQGEGEHTFGELVERLASGSRDLTGIAGTLWRDAEGVRRVEARRSQQPSLDSLPAPDRSLIKRYQGRYFFTAVRPMASIFTSRGCSFDCNFCAIWEYYERRVRYLSAEAIADQMAACEEPFIFILDDNFLVNRRRLVSLCDELERRGIKKYWMTQGRTDFVADNPELMARLADNGLVGLLSGYESNDPDSLAALRKKSSHDKNLRANEIMAELGIFSTGIFMVRPDWTAEQFQALYDTINSLKIGIPLITILTPLPGTQLYRARKDELLTTDHRLFDLLHPVLPTRLPREEFYRQFARSVDAVKPSIQRAMKNFARKNPRMVLQILPGLAWFYARTFRYQRLHRDPSTFLRDEEGLLNGPGMQRGLTWDQITYPTADSPQPTIEQDGAQITPPLWSAGLAADRGAAK
jgi:radical SAM superfamily enzyme YgiQ (UPF0313 family)